MTLKEKAQYLRKSASLLKNLLFGNYIHCNLQITRRCNFKCQICDFWKVEHAKERELSLFEISLISNKLSRFGALVVSLAGGEPAIREDLLDIIRIISLKHFPILITNGWYITEKQAYELWDAGLQEISVSIDYPDAKRHDEMRGYSGAFDRALNALKVLKTNRPRLNNRVHMISVLMDDNIDDIERLILLAVDLGVTYMVNLYSYHRGKKAVKLPKQQITAHLLALKKKYPNFVSLSAYLERMDTAVKEGGIGNCKAGKYYFNIDNYGNVSRCTETTDLPVGNIMSEDPLFIRSKLLNAQGENMCSHCWTSCRGWAESMHGTGQLKTWKEFYTSVKDYN